MKVVAIKRYTASFDVDPQCGFSELCPLELPVPGALDIVPELNANAELATMRVASKDAHSSGAVWVATPENPQFSPVGLPDADIRWNRHCEVGTPGFEFLPGLPHPSEYAYIAYKGLERDAHPYGACYHDLGNTRSTGIIEFMKLHDIRTVIVGGLALDYCVKTTALQLQAARFNVIVNLASTRALGDPEATIRELRDHEVWVVQNSQFITDVNKVGLRDDFDSEFYVG